MNEAGSKCGTIGKSTKDRSGSFRGAMTATFGSVKR